MTQISFNTLYYSACLNIKHAEMQLKKIQSERVTACTRRKQKLDKMEHNIIVEDLPILRKIAFNLRRNNYPLFLQYSP